MSLRALHPGPAAAIPLQRRFEGPFDTAAAAHLLRRAGFAAPASAVEQALALGLEGSIARLFEEPGRDRALEDRIGALLPTGEIAPLQSWWMALVLGAGAPLRERVALMWHDHFATSFDKVQDGRMMHAQNRLFREKGLGDFRELLHAVAVDPAMLVWLDGNENERGKPNENFAREVMELFALGIGHYSEADVREAARAFTGWGTAGRSFAFRAMKHDAGPKTIFGKSGAWTGDQAIDLVLAEAAAPRHVARRLLEEFVRPDPSEVDVAATAAALVANGWHVGRTIESLLGSQLFFAAENRRSRIAGPVELVARAAGETGARIAPRDAAEAAGRMGQSLFRPPSVKGWDGGRTWIDAGTWIARHNFLAGLARAHVEASERVTLDLRASIGDASSASEAAEAVVSALLPGVEAPETRARVRRAAENAGDVDRALAAAATLVLTSPEYQLV